MTEIRLEQRQLERLLEVSRLVLSELDLEAVLSTVLEVARELTGARYAAVGVLDGRAEELERFVFLGIDDETRKSIGPLPRGRGILGELIRKPEPLRLSSVSAHPHSYGFPAGHPEMNTFLGVPILIRDEVWGNLYLTEKAGGEDFDEADQESATVLAECAAIAIHNARLYEGAEERRQELERAVRGLEATSEIARAVGGETDLPRVLELIVKRGRALVDAGSVLILLAERDELRVAASAGEVPQDVSGGTVPVEGSMLGDVLRSGQPERVADLSSRMNFRLRDIGLDAQAALLVPLTFRGRPRGVLAAFDRLQSGPEFGIEDQQLLSGFAASAATAVATAQTVESERLRHTMEASEQERRRWARDLHDQTLQELGGLKVLLESAGRTADPARMEQAVEQATEQIEFSIRGLQSLITELRPATLDELGVKPAVESLAERTARLTGLALDLELDLAYDNGRSPARLAPDVESTAYRLVQEALNNVVKHSRAERATIAISESADTVTITVRDDGQGFERGQAGGGFGLLGMRERAELVGGTLEIESSPGKGTTVVAELPVRQTDSRVA